MITWSQILYGVALTAVGEAVLTVAVPRWRRPVLVGTAVAGAVLAVLGWQAVLHLTHAREFPPTCRSARSRSAGKTLAAA